MASLQLITHILSDENTIRQKAEKLLEEKKNSAPDDLAKGLGEILSTPTIDPQYRTLAAVILRKQIVNLSNFKEDTINTLKHFFLQALQNTKEREILRSLTYLISSFFGTLYEVEEKWWEDLLHLLMHWSNSPNEHQREALFDILSQILISLGIELEFFFDKIESLLAAGLKDNSIKVRIACLNTTIQYLINIESFTKFQPLIPNMFEIIVVSIKMGDEDSARIGLELFIELAEILPLFLTSHLEALLESIYTLTTDKKLESSTRYSAVEFFVTLSESKPSLIRKIPQALAKFIYLLLLMMTEIEDNDNWRLGEDHDAEDEEYNVGIESLDRIAVSIKGNTLVPLLFKQIETLRNSDNWKHRYTSIMSISIISEGCNQLLVTLLDQVTDFILPLSTDKHERVRWAVCHAVGQLCMYFSPVFQIKYHQKIMQIVKQCLEDNSHDRIQSQAAITITFFCNDNPNIKLIMESYLQDLLVKLVEVIKQGKPLVIEQSVTAVAVIATCVTTKFVRYYADFIPFLKSILFTATADNLSKLRGKAIEAISLIAVAVGKQTFLPDAKEILDAMLNIQLNIDSADELYPFLQQAWARLCKVIGADFVPYLAALVPQLLKSAGLPPELKIIYASSLDEEKWTKLVELGENKNLVINTCLIQEKLSALQILTWFLEELNDKFFPYVNDLAKIVSESIRFIYNEQIRIYCASLIPHLISSVASYYKTHPEIQFEQIFSFLLNLLLDALREERSLDVLSNFLSTLLSCLSKVENGVLTIELFDKILKLSEGLVARYLAQRKIIDEQIYKESDKEEKDSIELEAVPMHIDIIQKLREVVIKSLRSCGDANSAPKIQNFCQTYFSFLNPQNRFIEKEVGILLFNDLVTLGAVQLYENQIGPIIHSLSHPSNPKIRELLCQSVYLLTIHYHTPQFDQYLPNILPHLHSLITMNGSRTPPLLPSTEAAILVFGKIIEVFPHSKYVEEEQLLQVWLNYLPVSNSDTAQKIDELFCQFFVAKTQPLVGPNFCNFPKILGLMVDICDKFPSSQSQVHQNVVSILKKMESNFPADLMRSAFSVLSSEQQRKLQQSVL